ncbi:MAG: hypothetical protein K9G58_04435 [Bacteroidales bacterium]|nr:hypothetical protein [Bacteroidales bacterium]MCF8387985.1 hypothetical protein [Bacteroidales bacterium]MCF8397393.1 hypothetical protein [Bacteroidales bacterium]
MKIEDLLPDTSRRTADLAVAFVRDNPGYLPPMIALSFSENHLMAMRASRVVWLCGKEAPELIQAHLEDIARRFPSLNNASAIRNFLNLYSGKLEKLSERTLGIMIDACFHLLEDPKSDIAHKVLSMELIYQASRMIPELKPVLKSIIELQFDESATAFQSRARKIMHSLNKEVAD